MTPRAHYSHRRWISSPRRSHRPAPGPDFMAPHLILVGVIVVYAFMATVISLNTPAWEASDEPAHVQNIETLVSGHWYQDD